MFEGDDRSIYRHKFRLWGASLGWMLEVRRTSQGVITLKITILICVNYAK